MTMSTSRLELLPDRGSYSPDDPITIEVRGEVAAGEMTVYALGEEVARSIWNGGDISLGTLPAGGYGIELVTPEGRARTAVLVGSEPRMRYGFTVDYRPGRDPSGLADTVRRLHLTDIQFYDWAYRHAALLGGGELYDDALGQPVSLDTVRDLIHAVNAAGARALGYAAVYAVGPQEWGEWKHDALLAASGEPYGLGDFLFLVDPAAPDWSASFTGQLAASVASVGFDGFHLDQYGYPKRATRPDGSVVDVAESFVDVISASRAAVPDSRLVFNNVNDFPTWLTASAPQDALYIEVWHPHDTLDDLARVVTRARAVGGSLPVVIAAYQHIYDSVPGLVADRSTSLTMATLFSHGATHLLAGEADRILVDPYYVRNHPVEPSTAELLTRWYDFLVEHDRLLLAPTIVDVTGSMAGDYNGDCLVRFGDAPISPSAAANTLWQRVTRVGDELVVHLINLLGQSDSLWDAERVEPVRPGSGELRFRLDGPGSARVRAADPDGSPRLVDLEVIRDGDFATAVLPDFATWLIIHLTQDNGSEASR
jgi:dextranase